MPQQRSPRRRVVRQRYACEHVGGVILSVVVCELECGHVVEGPAGMGRRRCSECKKEQQR